MRRHQVRADAGGPLKIRQDRIRTTHLAMRDNSAWWGSRRAVIDPNHTPQVEGDHYLSEPTPAQRQLVDTVIAGAQHDLLRRARPPAVLTDAGIATLAAGYPQLIASLGLDDEVIAELMDGQRDVFSAACADQLSGLHGPAGKPCPARGSWIILAIATCTSWAPRASASSRVLAFRGPLRAR